MKLKKQGKGIGKRTAAAVLAAALMLPGAISIRADKAKSAQPLKVLAIGNSFTADATRDLYGIASADNFDLELTVLYHGGSSLETHWNKFQDDQTYEAFNYGQTGAPSSIDIKASLARNDWDIVILQQVSSGSPRYSTYQPYLSNLTDAIKAISPDVEFVIHQTWSCYKGDSRIAGGSFGTQESMFEDLQDAYRRAAESLGEGTRIIPSGAAWQKARSILGDVLNRDLSSHANARGGYLAAAVWYEVLSGNSILDNSYNTPVITNAPAGSVDELVCTEVTPVELEVLKRCAHEAVNDYDYLMNYAPQPEKDSYSVLDVQSVLKEVPVQGPWYYDAFRTNSGGAATYANANAFNPSWGSGGGGGYYNGSFGVTPCYYFGNRITIDLYDRLRDPQYDNYIYGASFRFEAPAAGLYELDKMDLNFYQNSNKIAGTAKARVVKGGNSGTPGTEKVWPADKDWYEISLTEAAPTSGWVRVAPVTVQLAKNEIVRVETVFVANQALDYKSGKVMVLFDELGPGSVAHGYPKIKYIDDIIPQNIYNAISKIAKIGTVTLDSGARISEAEDLLGELNDDDQALVTNSNVISEAKLALERLRQIKAMLDSVNNAIAKIDSIGTVTLDSEAAIEEAKTAYGGLTGDQKALVTNYNTLENAITALAALKEAAADQAAADAVIAKINAIGTVTLDSEAAIEEAKTAYAGLTGDQKALVTNYNTLESAIAALAALKEAAADQAAADAVIAKINAIGTVTLDSEAAIQEAKTAYGGLTGDQKALVTNYNMLENAIAALAALKEAAADQAAADAVIAKINAIGTVTLDSEAAIEEAKAAYAGLTGDQKALVTNYNMLENAIATLAALKEAAADQAAADAVIAKINAIGTVTLDSEAAIEEAKAAYAGLTGDQKALVTNYNTLENAIAAFAALENPPAEDDSSIPDEPTGSGGTDDNANPDGGVKTGETLTGYFMISFIILSGALLFLSRRKRAAKI